MGKEDECLELKNIKYQTMLLHKNTPSNPTEENILNMENFLMYIQGYFFLVGLVMNHMTLLYVVI